MNINYIIIKWAQENGISEYDGHKIKEHDGYSFTPDNSIGITFTN